MSEIRDQRAEAREYLEENQVLKLFDYLGAKIAKDKPDDPNEYLLSQIANIINIKADGGKVSLFSEQEIEVMFSIFDLTNRGYVTKEQYLKALNAVGVKEPNIFPLDGDDIKLDKKTFVSQV